MRLVFASNNTHKLEEVRKILVPHEIISLKEIGCEEDIAETGETLEANSLIKARFVEDWLTAHPAVGVDGIFADDTGLEIMALGGQPGVHTARWAGEAHNDAMNRAKALTELTNQANRLAQFRTVITLIRGKHVEQVEGVVRGKIALEEKGENGFGYDPLFIPDGYEKTFAELSAEIKNSISHRARALAALLNIL